MNVQQKARQQGYDAYHLGVPYEKNPYQWVSHKQGGVFKSSAWIAGWKEAEKEDKMGVKK